MDRVTLENKIRIAFRGVVLGSGVSLRRAQIIDCHADDAKEETFEHLPPEEPMDDWTLVRLSEENSDCIAHLDAEGLRYYLPALMLSVLANYDAGSMRVIGTIDSLDPQDAYGGRRFALLNDVQREAIACFLKALPELVPLCGQDAKVAARSLSGYWERFLPALNNRSRGL